MNRREALGTMLAVLGMAVRGSVTVGEELSRCFDLEAARVLGHACLRVNLGLALEGGRAARLAARDRGTLSRAIAQDFATGDVVVVEQWVLARTEAAFCAHLACLTA
jgi:hypothetical protein